MNERNGVGAQLLLALALALIAGLVLAVYLIGSETLRTFGLILVSALAIALVIGASALPIRAWRRKDNIGETHYVDGTKTVIKETRVIDGRAVEGPKIFQMPQMDPSAASVYPAVLRAAWQAGANSLSPRSANGGAPEPDEYVEIQPVELDFDAPRGWDGDIRR